MTWLIGFLVTRGALAASSQPDIDVILAKMQAAREHRHAMLCAYSAIESYVLQNKHLHPSAQMKVHLTYKRNEGKQAQILSLQASGVSRRFLEHLLQEETHSIAAGENKSAVTASNYRFALLEMEACGDLSCYKLRLTPRHESEYLIDGTAWVDAKDYAIVRISGHLSKSPSFWIRRPEIEQRFEKVDGFWMPSYNRSSSHVFLLGNADLTIEYSAYQIHSCQDTQQ